MLRLFIIMTAAVFTFQFHQPACVFAGPGAGFVKMDLLPETLDPFDLYFNFTIIRYMRPGGMLEIPRSHYIAAEKSNVKNTAKLIKRLKIIINKSDDKKWPSFFDPFYNGKTVICEYDRSRNLTKASMLDETGEMCLQNINSFDAAGRMTAETAEVFDRVFGHDGSYTAQDARPRTGEIIHSKTVKHSYSPKGKLTRTDYKNLETEGYFDYSYDSLENLIKLSCYTKKDKKPYYTFEYSYNEKRKLSRINWFNWDNALEMYYEYVYDDRGNCVKVKCPPYLLADRESAKLENDFKYDDSNRVTDIVYYNWLKDKYSRPDSLIHCSYDENGLLKEIEIEPAQMNPGKKYYLKYSYEFF